MNLNIDKCKSYCYEANTGSCYEDSGLCDSCEKILEEKIKKPFNKTNVELCVEIIEIKKQLANMSAILEKMNIKSDNENNN